jgi:hypothetical protein
MGRVLKIDLTVEQEKELIEAQKKSDNHVFRQRCQIILLKFANRKTSDICQIVGLKSQLQANYWIKLYKKEYANCGINILYNTKGQGRNPIFDKNKDTEIIEKVVKTERQKLENAKVILEKELNKTFHIKTLQNFLKVLTGDTKG